MTMQLMLVGIKKVEFKDGGVKYKHLFLSDRDRIYLGWADDESRRSEVVDSDTFDPARARTQTVQIDEKDGKPTYKVIL